MLDELVLDSDGSRELRVEGIPCTLRLADDCEIEVKTPNGERLDRLPTIGHDRKPSEHQGAASLLCACKRTLAGYKDVILRTASRLRRECLPIDPDVRRTCCTGTPVYRSIVGKMTWGQDGGSLRRDEAGPEDLE